uniref:Dolichyl-diphosphooligosaccharide--protein glycosyltransferase subunit STT3B n=1 Tax=Branchiostoma floridae TaxID=7739 RepID=C3Y141_BRAFL|eukprot:XP_002609571.1 hypothetical protein BRAFLDRAFT_101929 [Branchiostoma floridae]
MAGESNIRTALSNPAGWQSLLSFSILALAYLAAFSSRLFAVIRFESIIHEFDPWFNYRSTHHLVNYGFYNFLNWFDERAWYPLGRIVGGTVYPGLMVTAGTIHWLLNSLHITVHIRDVCVFLAPTFRSVAGSYDNEGIAIFALLFTYFLWVKSVKTGSIFWAGCTALAYFYMVSAWGGYVYIINLIPLHVFVLLLMGRFSYRIFVAYCAFFILGLLLSMQVPFVGFQPIRTSEHMASAGVFALLIAYGFLKYLHTHLSSLTKSEMRSLFFFAVAASAAAVLMAVVYAKIHIPIIASVSEHQPTTWVSFFFDLHVLVCTFPAGVWFCIKKINDERVFIVLYAISASYFAGVMVRLMLTLTPVVCILSAIAFSNVLERYLVDDTPKVHHIEDESEDDEEGDKRNKSKDLYDKVTKTAGKVRKIRHEPSGEPESLGGNVKTIVVMAVMMILMMFAVHCTWVTSNAYSSPSVVLASYNHDGEAYYWLRQNTDDHSRVMSWWDYGYQIAGMANRTTLVDNNTWNNSHIALVGKAMSSNETRAYEIMKALDVDYVLVIFGGVIGYSGDDINKFLWMVRIAEGEHPKEIREGDYFTPQGEFRVDKAGSKTLLNCLMYKLCYYRFGEMQVSTLIVSSMNCLMYKLCYYRFGEMQLDFRTPPGFDRTRNVEIGNKDISFQHLEEAYTTEHWLVRIYKVKKQDNRVRLDHTVRKTDIKPKTKFTSRKSGKRKRGFIKNKLLIKKGKRPSSKNKKPSRKSSSKK